MISAPWTYNEPFNSFVKLCFHLNDSSLVYSGDPREETELLTWLLYQMKEDTIENINRDLLIRMINQYEFIGVYFCKFFNLLDDVLLREEYFLWEWSAI